MGHPQAAFHFCVTFPFHPPPDGQRGGEARPHQLLLQVPGVFGSFAFGPKTRLGQAAHVFIPSNGVTCAERC